ncbi:MAG: hypothetical protein IPO81_28160 [Kouleothrix sp.]|nr:hypothetical protein [Kouleothrix sp.]
MSLASSAVSLDSSSARPTNEVSGDGRLCGGVGRVGGAASTARCWTVGRPTSRSRPIGGVSESGGRFAARGSAA